ncbi:hypothetical protein EJB05_43897, partial [Eragrostis curvula]
MPAFDHVPLPYDGPSAAEIARKRSDFLSSSLIALLFQAPTHLLLDHHHILPRARGVGGGGDGGRDLSSRRRPLQIEIGYGRRISAHGRLPRIPRCHGQTSARIFVAVDALLLSRGAVLHHGSLASLDAALLPSKCGVVPGACFVDAAGSSLGYEIGLVIIFFHAEPASSIYDTLGGFA